MFNRKVEIMVVVVCVRAYVCVQFLPLQRLLLTEQNKCNARDQTSDFVPKK